MGEVEAGEGSRKKQHFQIHLEGSSDGGQGTAGQEGDQEAKAREAGRSEEQRGRRRAQEGRKGGEASERHCSQRPEIKTRVQSQSLFLKTCSLLRNKT